MCHMNRLKFQENRINSSVLFPTLRVYQSELFLCVLLQFGNSLSDYTEQPSPAKSQLL